MKIFVGITDGSWYDYLRDHALDEFNCWKPSAKPLKAIQEGDLFLFKLKAGASLARHRLGQGAFRALVADAYHDCCAITGERTMPSLEVRVSRRLHDDFDNGRAFVSRGTARSDRWGTTGG